MSDRMITVVESVVEQHLGLMDKFMEKLIERYPQDAGMVEICRDVLKSNENVRMYIKIIND